jgi:hypothetical protein
VVTLWGGRLRRLRGLRRNEIVPATHLPVYIYAMLLPKPLNLYDTEPLF